MANLTDYLDSQTLQQLQDAFAAVAKMPVRICDPAGKPITAQSSNITWQPGPTLETTPAAQVPGSPGMGAPVLIKDELVGRVVLEGQAALQEGAVGWLLQLMAGMLGRLYDREMQLRNRMLELATLYRLTTEFTGQKDLQSVLNLAAKTVVDVMKAKGCAIRLLNEDDKELVIKAVHNLSPEYLNKGPILVSRSIIDREVLSTGKTVYIADERTDPRVLYPAEAQREGIVSALLAPMFYKGHPEGVIRVYMASEYAFDWFEISLLEAIAAQAAAALVNARLYEEAVNSANIKRQLRLAAEVQRQMIPSEPPQLPGLDIGALYVPCFELGGDFFDFIELPPDNMGMVICDVSGKGIGASLLMASIRASLRAHAANIYDLAEVLERVNHDLCEDKLVSDFATLFYGVLDYRTRKLTFANAGHPPPLLWRNNAFMKLSTGGSVIGIDEDSKWAREVITLQKGDVLLAYTDGLNEAMNFEDVAFGHERIEKAILNAIGLGYNADGIVKHVLWEMRRFTGLQTRGDDLTMVGIKVL